MRQADTYRGARRNKARDMGLLHVWKDPHRGYAAQANHKAKLAQRARICAAARDVACQVAAKAVLTRQNPAPLVLDAMRVFWSKLPRTRVNFRILKELRA